MQTWPSATSLSDEPPVSSQCGKALEMLSTNIDPAKGGESGGEMLANCETKALRHAGFKTEDVPQLPQNNPNNTPKSNFEGMFMDQPVKF